MGKNNSGAPFGKGCSGSAPSPSVSASGEYPSREAQLFMARFFGLNVDSELRSHEPHAMLSRHRAAYKECSAAGWLRTELFNDFGSLRITLTPKGRRSARLASMAFIGEWLAASGIEARGVETEGLQAQAESPGPKGDAPAPSPSPQP